MIMFVRFLQLLKIVSHSIFFTQTRMTTHPHLTFVYFNEAKSSFQLRICKDIFFINLKIKLNTLLRYPKNQRVVELKYHSPSIDNEEKIGFTMLESKTDDDYNDMRYLLSLVNKGSD